MARQIITLMTDDLEGGEAEETVEFALDGVAYTIDLNDKNAKELRDFVVRFANAATRIGKVSTVGHITPSVPKRGLEHPPVRTDRAQNTIIRDWAANNGYRISERGRIPQHVVNAYNRNIPNPAAHLTSGPDFITAENDPTVQELEQTPEPVIAKVGNRPRKETPAKAAPAKKALSRTAPRR